MFGLRFRSGSRRNPKVLEFDSADKEKFELAKTGYIPDKCPIPLDDFIHTAKFFSDTAGSFCFEKAFAFISDFKSERFGSLLTSSNAYVQIFDVLEQIANCDRKYYILSYLEDTDVAHKRPLKISYMALFKTAGILQNRFEEKKVWKIVRFLSEVKRYLKCRVCAVNLYMYISQIDQDSEIDWREILDRIEGMIKYLLSDCKKPDEEKKSIDHWDTDSDVEDLNATLDFLPVHEMLELVRLEDLRRKFDKVRKKKNGNFKMIMEKNRQFFRQYHLEQVEILKKKREKQLEAQKVEHEEKTKRERKESVRAEREQQERRSCQKHLREKYREIDGKVIIKGQKRVFLLTPDELADLKLRRNKVESTNNSVYGTGSGSTAGIDNEIDWKMKTGSICYDRKEERGKTEPATMSMSESFDSRSTINSMWSDVSEAPSKESASATSMNSFSEIQRMNTPTPLSTPAPSSTSTIRSDEACPLVKVFTGKSGNRRTLYINRLFKEMKDESATTVRRNRVITQIKKSFARIEKLTDYELLLDNVDQLVSQDTEGSSTDETDIDEELDDDASLVLSTKSETILKRPSEKESANHTRSTGSESDPDLDHNTESNDSQQSSSVGLRNYSKSESSSYFPSSSEQHNFTEPIQSSSHANTASKDNSYYMCDNESEAEKRRNQKIRRIKKIVKKKAWDKYEKEENDRAEVHWFSDRMRKKFEEIVHTENNVKSVWWKTLENSMQCAKELKNLREDSAENVASRYLKLEKLVGYEEEPENEKDKIGLENYYRREEMNRDIAQRIKEKVLKKRFNFHMEIHQPDWEEAEKEKKKKMKAKKLLQDVDQSEGAYYVDSSDGDEDEEEEEGAEKKSYVFQNMRKMFIDELYTLMLLFEAQYQMVAVNVVRCVGFMNQLSNQFDFLSKELEEYDATPESKFKLRTLPIKPRNNLIHWFMHVYQLLLAKFSLYSADILGPSCLNPEDFSEFQTFDNGFNFIEKCVDYCKKARPYFLCICIGGRQQISEKDGNFEACMVLPGNEAGDDGFRKTRKRLLSRELHKKKMCNNRFQQEHNLPLLRIIRKKYELEQLDKLPLEQALQEIEKLNLNKNEREFMLNNAKYGFLAPRECSESENEEDVEYDLSRFVPIVFRVPSALNPEHTAEGMVSPDDQAPAFEMTTRFVREHFHTQALQYLQKMPANRKPFRLYNYDKNFNSSFFGEVIERNIYMVLIFRGKVRKWERRAFDFFGVVLPELRCSSSLRLLSKAAHTPELGMIGREVTSTAETDSA